MKDEIKEILDKLKNGFCSALTYEKLLDYITNLQKEKNISDDYVRYLHNENKKLQKENERLKERCDYLQRSCDRKEEQRDDARMEYMEQEDYKSRCENVQDLILNELSHLKANDEETWNKEFYDENNKLDYRKLCIELLNQVINKLNGGDKE